MQITCPNCHAHISADNINVQTMTAVCHQCDAVFQFEPPREKSKRLRKVSKPDGLDLTQNNEHLHMQFHTNWRLDKNDDFISSAILGVAFGMVAFIMMVSGLFVDSEASLLLPILATFFASISLMAFYRVALVIYNHTEIDMRNDRIKIARQPLPTPFDAKRSVSLMNVERIRCEETKKSRKEQYDTPRYRVWAETDSGKEKLIVNDVTEEYAYFIAQTLDEHLVNDMLIDIDADDDYELLTDDNLFLHESEQSNTQQR